MAVLLTQPRIRFLDSNGAPLAGGKIYTYTAGTTTPQATYTNAGAGTPNANPVVLDSAGYADIWITGSYKIVVHDSADNLISSTDNITGFSTGAVGATFLDGSFTLQNTSNATKQVVFNLAGIGTGTTVTIGVPNGNFTLVDPAIPQTWTAAQIDAVVAITYGATITPNFSLGNNFQLQLTGSPTVANPTNPTAGQSGNLYVYQDATGSRAITWGWGFMNPGGSLPTLQTAGGSLDVLKYTVTAYNSSNVTITLATPGVLSFSNHGFKLGQQIQLVTTGALPTGLTASTTYYVVPIDLNTFSLATSLVNAAANTTIATSGSQSGVHTLTGLTIALTNPVVTIPAQIVAFNAISGFLPSSIAGTHTTASFTLSAGQASDAGNTVYISKGTTTAWAASNGNAINGTDASSSTLANSTTYHIFVCSGGSGTGCFVSASLTPTFPTGYTTSHRRVSSFNTDSSGNPIPYTSIESEGGGTINWLSTQVLDMSAVTVGTSRVVTTLSVPTGIKVGWLYRMSTTSGNGFGVIITSGDETDVAPTAFNGTAAPLFDFAYSTSPAEGISNSRDGLVTTNTSGQIGTRASSASETVYAVTRGWKDFRRS
jgi:hypothetical protein